MKKQANDSSVKPLEGPTEENSLHFKVALQLKAVSKKYFQ